MFLHTFEGIRRCMPNTRSQGNPLIPLDLEIERTLRANRRMVNTEGVQNPAAAGDIHNQSIHLVGQKTADQTTARLT